MSEHQCPLTVVLVHGAFADSSSWDGVIERLQAAGIQVTAAPNPLRGISHDSAYVAGFMSRSPGRSSPSATGVTLDAPRPALHLYQEYAVWAHNQDIDLGDGAVHEELEVRPRAIRLEVGQRLAQERERLTLVRMLRRGDLGPCGFH